MTFTFEKNVYAADVKTEDGGQAKLLEFSDEALPVFVRVQSWAEDKKHHLFDTLVGSRVRITIETF